MSFCGHYLKRKQKHQSNDPMIWGLLDSWVVSHLALNMHKLCHALGHEFEPWWQQTLFWTQVQHLRFLHDCIWFIWFDTIICLSNLSCELWNRKLKINQLFFKKMTPCIAWETLLKNWPILASFCLFSFFSHYNFNTNWKSIDGVLGIRTWGRRMVGADKTTELWWPPIERLYCRHNSLLQT